MKWRCSSGGRGGVDPGTGISHVLDGVAVPLMEQVHSLGMLLDPNISDKQVAVVARVAFHQAWLVSQ